ncbi:MAG: alpha-galactosidase [Candidatus Latescibacterota bacterium]
MHAQFLVDKHESRSTAMQVPAFAWVRADAGRFVWEEALFEGNLLSVHHSALGRGQSKENVYQKLTRHRFPRPHLYAFELEVDGELLRDQWEWRGEAVTETKEGFRLLVVELEHTAVPLTVEVHTLLDGTSFLVRWLRLHNRGERSCALSRVFAWCGLIACEEEGTTIVRRDSDRGFSLGRYRNQAWGMEGEFLWLPLAEGTFSVTTQGNKYHPPLFVLRSDATGEMALLHVECTPDAEVSFTLGSEAGGGPRRPWGGEYVYARAGLGGAPPVRRLQPGESAVTPAVHLSVLYGDLDAGVQALHEHLRTSVIPSAPAGRAHLVEYNHTGYTLNAQISRQGLRQEVEMAAAIGVELFLVDAGWFGPAEKSWGESVGDWRENPILGEGGLAEVFAHARGLGMKCGLWMPPEWVCEAAPIRQAHPEWFLRGRTFDLLNPEVGELAGSPSDTFPFVSRGLDPSRDFRVTFDSSGRSVVLSGLALGTVGLPVRVPAPLMSELLLVQPE